jgi:cyanate permease
MDTLLSAPATRAEAAPPPRYRWVIAFALVMANWGTSLPAISFGLLLPSIREDMGLTPLQEGWLGGAVQIGSIAVTIGAVARLSSAPPRRLMLFSTFAASLCVFLMSGAVNFAMLLLSRASFGAFSATRVPGRALLVQQWFPRGEYPIVSGVTIGFIGIVEFLALSLTPWIRETTGSWRATLAIFGGVNASIFLFWLLFGRERRTTEYIERVKAAPPVSLRTALGYRQLWLAGLAGMGATMSWQAFGSFWPSYMLEAHDFSLQRSGVLFGLISLASVPTAIGLGVVASRLDDRRPMFILCGLVILGGMFGMMVTDISWAVAICVLAVGAAWGFMPLIFTIPYEIPGIPVTHVAAGTALLSILITLGGFLGPVATGALTEVTGSRFIALIVSASMSVTLILFSLPMRPRVRQAA